ncbi:hypothetical protein HKBW3S09_01201, partial [Candidatus Hakubella thermalkaliphila]
RAISLIEPEHIVCIQVNDVVGLILVYTFAFSLLKKMGPPLAMLLELGGKLGLKGKS